MKNTIYVKWLFWLATLLVLFLNGCSKNPQDNYTNTLTQTWEDSLIDLSDFNVVSKQVIESVKGKNMENLSKFIWKNWVILSPYNNINSGDIKLSKNEIEIWFSNQNIYNRWDYDGSWEPIKLNLEDYFNTFVYDVDFANAPEKILNESMQRWNTINNIQDFYTGSQTIEYYFPWFDPQYEWIDWKSLTLIFERTWGNRYLIWISHWQRTI